MASMEPRWDAAYCPFKPFCDNVPEKWAAGLVLEGWSVGVDVATGGGGLGSWSPWLVWGTSLSWGGGLGITFGGGFSTDSTCCVIENDAITFLLKWNVSWLHAVHARPHPESDFQLDLAVGSGALQQETLVQSHIGDVEEATQRQVQSPEQRFLLVFFDLGQENNQPNRFSAP